MATAIRQVELSQLYADLDRLDGYDRCMLVFRWRGSVVGRAFVAVERATLGAAEVSAAARTHLTGDAVRAWIEDTLQFDERPSLSGMSPPSATVAICTRERPDDLERTLSAACALSPVPREILVIDNAPTTDRTRQIVARFAGVRYVVERARGLNRARNRALREATGDIVAFTDDDAMPEPGWLGGLIRNFADPRVLCVTGLTLPVELETPAQELFEEHCPFARGFVRRVFDGRIDNPLIVARVGAGANMAVRRSLPQAAGWFDERLDAGTPAQSGGDHEMFTRILSSGHRIVYEPHAVSWHRHRRTVEELQQVVRGYGTGVYAMWTGLLLEKRDLGVLRLAWRWFRHDHLPLLRRPSRLRTPGPRDALRMAELRGCLAGPRAWFASRRGRRAVA
jgi:glycosyltransferase involved in cell wall biosynthesis